MFRADEIRQRARHPEDAIMGACGKVRFLYRVFEMPEDSAPSWQCTFASRGLTAALLVWQDLRNRWNWIIPAAIARWRMVSLFSPVTADESSWKSKTGTSTWRSMRFYKRPLMRCR